MKTFKALGEALDTVVVGFLILIGMVLVFGFSIAIFAGTSWIGFTALRLTWDFLTTSSPIVIFAVLGPIYAAIGFFVQRRTYRIKVSAGGYYYSTGSYHRRKVPDPSIPFVQRLGLMFFWGIPFLLVVPLFPGKRVFPIVRIVYRVAMGDTRPTEKSPFRELLDLPSVIRERRRIRWDESTTTSVVFGLLVLCGIAWWALSRSSPAVFVNVFMGAYLGVGLATQRNIHRIKVGERLHYKHRRIVPDPAVSLWQRLVTVLFWGIVIPGDLWTLWLSIFAGLRMGYRWVLGDTQPTQPIPPEEVLFPDESGKIQGSAALPQNGHRGVAAQAAFEQTKELVGAGSTSKN